MLTRTLTWYCPVGRFVRHEVVRQLNKAYASHISSNPQWDGEVAILAHSLGSSVVWDILYPTETTQDVMDGVHPKKPTPPMPKLDFTLKHCFAIGSPVASCMVLRAHDVFTDYTVFSAWDPSTNTWKKRGGSENKLSQKNSTPENIPIPQFHNIYHPLDPIAYRMEPLILAPQHTLPAIKLMQYQSPTIHTKPKQYIMEILRTPQRLLNSGAQHLFRGVVALTSYYMTYSGPSVHPTKQPWVNTEIRRTRRDSVPRGRKRPRHRTYSLPSHPVSVSESTYEAAQAAEAVGMLTDVHGDEELDLSSIPMEPNSEPPVIPYRMDMELPLTSLPPTANEYWGALRAHFEYWSSLELMWYILNTLGREFAYAHEPNAPPAATKAPTDSAVNLKCDEKIDNSM
jgi:hypothetical protein